MQILKSILEPFGVTGIPTFRNGLSYNELIDYIGDELETYFKRLQLKTTLDHMQIEDVLERQALELGATKAECNANTSNTGDKLIVHAYIMYYYVEGFGWPFMKIITNKFPLAATIRPPVYGDHIK